MNSHDKIIYQAFKIGSALIPLALGAYMFIAAWIGYGKPPVKWHVRIIVGFVGLTLVVLSIRGVMLSK
jgi:tetrahydromethanopterin S-methyltransferase subunit E